MLSKFHKNLINIKYNATIRTHIIQIYLPFCIEFTI